MKILAYGSNLSTERLRRRVPSARFIGRARLDSHRLQFHKRSTDGSGKANVLFTGSGDDCVWGAVFECSPTDKAALDRAEPGYTGKSVDVVMDDGSIERVHTYMADAEVIDEKLKPYTWYLGYVLAGAEEQSLPKAYVEAVRQQCSIRDPDPAREAGNTFTPAD